MNSKLLSEKALTTIDQYLHFKVRSAVTSIPYFNNNRTSLRAGLRAAIGKGSPRDIYEEVEIALAKEHVALTPGSVASGAFVPGVITGESLKHFLVDKNIGIDCSGFAYYVLNSESLAQGKNSLDKHLSFPRCKGILGMIRAKMRPIENANVATFASDKNTRIVELKNIAPGHIITMLSSDEIKNAAGRTIFDNRDHILVVHQVEYQNFIPTTVHYSHSIAWPTDGEYGHGVRQGIITIFNPEKPLTMEKPERKTTHLPAQKKQKRKYALFHFSFNFCSFPQKPLYHLGSWAYDMVSLYPSCPDSTHLPLFSDGPSYPAF